jgi:TRAP-type transport system small permease protein
VSLLVSYLRRLSDVVNRLMELLGALALLAIVALVLASITMRNLNIQFLAAYEVTRILFLWMAFVGITVAFKRGAHVRVEVFLNLFPYWLRRGANVVTTALALGFFVYTAYVGFDLLAIVRTQRMPSSGLSALWLYLPVFVSFAVMALHAVSALSQRSEWGQVSELASEGARSLEVRQ